MTGLANRVESAYHGGMAEKRSKRKQASLGCLFWIAIILLVIILFFLNKKTITEVLTKTGAADFFKGRHKVEMTGKTVPAVEPAPKTEKPAGDGSAEPAETQTEKPSATDKKPEPEKAPEKTTPKQTAEKTTDKPVAKPAQEKPVAQKQTSEKPKQTQTATRNASLYFVTIDSDGRVVRREITRAIPKTDSPMSEALGALFAGTNSAESGKGLRSLIPTGTRLLSATVKDGVATINVSEEFQFNQYGIEGYLGQLAQVVFTATAFPTVKSVQFLIEGQRREYLGAEGVWIGTPLSRDKF